MFWQSLGNGSLCDTQCDTLCDTLCDTSPMGYQTTPMNQFLGF